MNTMKAILTIKVATYQVNYLTSLLAPDGHRVIRMSTATKWEAVGDLESILGVLALG